MTAVRKLYGSISSLLFLGLIARYILAAYHKIDDAARQAENHDRGKKKQQDRYAAALSFSSVSGRRSEVII